MIRYNQTYNLATRMSKEGVGKSEYPGINGIDAGDMKEDWR